jgi:hypothetical protein
MMSSRSRRTFFSDTVFFQSGRTTVEALFTIKDSLRIPFKE